MRTLAEPSEHPTPKPLRRLLPLVRPYRGRLAYAAAVSAVGLAAQTAQPLVVQMVIDDALVAGRRQLLWPLAGVALGIGLLESLTGFLRRTSAGRVALGVEYDLRNRLYAHMQRLQVGFHDGWQSGQLVSRAINDISAIRRFLGFNLLWLGIIGTSFVVVLAMLFHLDATLACVTVVVAVPVGIVSYRFARAYHRLSRRSQDQAGDLATVVEESATGVRIIKAYGRMGDRSALFRRRARAVLETNTAAARARARFWSADHLLLQGALVVIVLAGGLRVSHGSLSIGGLVAFVTYQLMLVWPMREIGWIIATGQEAVTAAERVFEVLDLEPDVADAPGAVVLDRAEGRLSFERVTFRYGTNRHAVLDGLDLEIAPGETMALVGATGAGKTTLAMLVPRFFDPAGGRVRLDGHDIRSLGVSSLRSHVSVAFEDPILFSASVRENLLMGDPDASDARLWEALRAAHADGFVAALPWGLDTRVGEQGYSLSGGQRQRLALARAIVGRPAVVVLDDPLSSVDVHTEAEIERALEGVLAGRTAILIAHRPSTVLLADRVAFIDGGRVVATGTHHDLLEGVPAYREVLAAGAASDFDDQVSA